MATPQETKNFLNQARQSGPSAYNRFSDDVLYSFLKSKNQIPDNAIWEEKEKSFDNSKIISQRPQQDLGFFAKSADWFINQDSYDWMKEGYNRSLTGMTEQLIKGEQRYDVESEDFTVLQDIGASLISFLMPLDILSMGVGAKAGSIAAGKFIKSGLIGNASKEASKITAGRVLSDKSVQAIINSSAVSKGLVGAVQQAPALALYEGAIGGVQAKLNGEDAFPAIAKGVFHGGVMGALTGSIGGGMGAKQASIMAQTKGNPIGLDKIRAYGIYGMPGQIAAESSIFSASELGHMLSSGEDLDANAILSTFARNVGLFGSMKVLHKGFSNTLKKGEAFIDEVDKASKKKRAKEKEALEKTQQTVAEKSDGARNEQLEITISKLDADTKLASEEFAGLRARLRRYSDMFDKNDRNKFENNPATIKELLNDLEGLSQNLKKKSNKNSNDLQLQADVDEAAALMRDKFKDYINGTAEPKTATKPVAKKIKVNEADDLVQKIAAERNVSATEVMNDPSLQIINPNTGEPLIVNKKPRMDVDKLKSTYQSILDTKPDNPASKLAKAKSELDLNKIKELPDFKRKIVKEKKTINEYIESQNLNRDNLDELYIGFSEFFRKRKGVQPSDFKIITDYAKFLDKKGLKLSQASRQLTDDFVAMLEKKGIATSKNQKSKVNNTLSRFYGTGGKSNKIPDGFAYSYMGTATETPSISQLGIDRGGTRAKPEKIALVEPKDYGLIRKQKKDLIDKGENLKVKGSQEISPETYDAATEILYNFGARGKDALNRLFIENIDFKKGIIREWSTGAGQKGKAGPRIDLNIGKVLPELFEQMKKIKGDRTSGNLFVDVKGKNVTGETINALNAKNLPKGVNLRGKKGKLTVADYRKMVTTDALNIGGDVLRDFVDQNLIGHTLKMKQRYTILEKNKLWKQFIEGRKKLEVTPKKPAKKKVTKRQVEKLNERIEATQQQVKAQKEIFESIPAYKNIEIKLNQKLGKYKGDRVLGQIKGHTIKISSGKVRPDTLPHEISHYVVDVLKKFGTALDKKLINRGVKMFGDEEKLVQSIGEYTLGRMTNKTLISKAKSFIKTFNARLKTMLNLETKEDVAYLLSRKVAKGKVPTNVKVKNYVDGLKANYQTDPSKVSSFWVNEVKNVETDILKKKSRLGLKEADINAIRGEFGIPNKGVGGWLKDGSVPLGKLEGYRDKLFELKFKNKNKKEILDDINTDYGIDSDTAAGIAKAFGQVDGDIYKLIPENRVRYETFVKNNYKKTERVTSADALMGIEGEITFRQKLINGFLPVYEVLRKSKLGKIADSMFAWETSFNTRRGRGKEMIDNMSEVLRPKYGKDERIMWGLFDRKRAEKRLKDSGYKLDKKTNKYVLDKNYKKPSWWQDSKHGVTKKEIDFVESMLFDKKSPEYKAKEIWKEFREETWMKFKEAGKKNLNPKEYENFLEEFNEKFVEGYFSRVATKEFMKYGLTSDAVEKVIMQKVRAKATAKARKEASQKHKMGTKEYENLYKKLTEKYEIEFEPELFRTHFYQMNKENTRVRNKFLLERGPLMPEFIEVSVNGKSKVIRVYEHTKRKSADAYVEATAKSISTSRHFPEFTDIGGKFGTGSNYDLLARLSAKDSYMAAYGLKAIQRLIGAEKVEPLGTALPNFFAGVAHTSAAIGLSSPTSGIKNILIGMPRNIATYGAINTARGVASLFSAQVWRDAKRKGILNYAPDTLELGKTPGSIMEKLFRFNAMTVTENMNRIVAAEAGKMYFQTKLNVLRNKPGMFGNFKKKEARRMMKDVWQVPEKDRIFLETGDILSVEGNARLKKIFNHIEQMSHFSTQGGTSAARLPLWSSSAIAKPFTLFQRMAYATTYDSAKNYFMPAIKNKNFAPLAKAALSHYVTGMALYGMYKWLFKTEPPSSAGSELDKASMYLWRSEFLGLFGEAISPYEGADRGLFQSYTNPVIKRNLEAAGKNFYKWYSGDQSLGKFLDNTALETIVLYNQYDTMKKGMLSKEYTDARKINNYERQFYIDRRGEFKMSSQQEFSRRQVYYKDLKEAIYVGNEEQIAKSYYAAYNYIITEQERMEGKTTMAYKHKKARQAISRSISAMEPGNLSAETPDGVILSKKADFMMFIKEKFGNKGMFEFRKSVRDYKKLKSKYDRIISKRKYFDKYSVYAPSKLK